jgi:CubicO group peptidase (beta-lactamase class C family)
VTADSYETFLQENILQPLEMSNTGYNHAYKIVENRAAGYSSSLDENEPINAPCWHVSTQYAAGGLYSTVGDLYKWDQALYSDQLVSKDTLDEIFTPSESAGRGGQHYGYGWFIAGAPGHRILEHSGAVNGFLSHMARYPDDHVTIIMLSNFDGFDLFPISQELASVVFDG